MREHDGEDSIILQNAMAFLEARREHGLVTIISQLVGCLVAGLLFPAANSCSGYIPKERSICHRLSFLVREDELAKIWPRIGETPLQPYVEIVRTLCIHDVVVVGGIGDDGVDRVIG